MTNEDNVGRRLAVRVRLLRERAGMTQEALADKLGLGYYQKTVSLVENGEREIRTGEAARWARALGVTRLELQDGLGWKGEPITQTGGGKAGTKGRGKRG